MGSKKNYEDWIEWSGGENPAPGKMVLIRMKEDETLPSERFPCLSDHLYWHKDCEIVAYKLVE